MIRRRLNKIISLTIMTAVIGSFVPQTILNNSVQASASVNENIELNNEYNTIALASNVQEQALETVIKAMIPAKAGNSTAVISEFQSCGTISYTLNDTTAESIAAILNSNMSQIVAGVQQVKQKGDQLSASPNSALAQKGTELSQSAQTVLAVLNGMQSLSQDEIIDTIKNESRSIKVYQYKALESSNGLVANSPSSIASEGFVVGGIIGLALYPADTYNAPVRNGEFNSSSDLIPIIDLSSDSGSAYRQSINLSGSNIKVVCDGMHINILNTSNKKLYVINNPVYNMFKEARGGSAVTDKDLNIISFPSTVSNLKISNTTVDLSSSGIKTSILNVSLTPKSSATGTKVYKYALPIDTFEMGLMQSVIGGMNLPSNIVNIITSVVQPGTFIMVPDVKNNVGGAITDTIDGITGAIGDLADAIEDLREDLEDKNDDVQDAWDKVFDRFDNEEGWGHRDGYTYYYDEDGISLKGVQNIDGYTYYFNRIDGAMETGWQVVDGKRCYFDKDKGYQVYNRWVQDGDDWYYVGPHGPVIKSDWVNSNGMWYYMKSDGKMTTGWMKINDSWYLFNEDGSMVSNKWKWDNDEWYYLKADGSAATNWNFIDGKWYCFKENSASLQTGWFRNDGNWYYSDSNGAMCTGWVSSSDGMCYLDETTGKMKKNEWLQYNGSWYYFNVNGIMVTGKRYINGTKYVFNSNGTLQ